MAAAIEGRDTILILHCDPSTGKLSQHQEVQLPGVALPTQVTHADPYHVARHIIAQQPKMGIALPVNILLL